MKDRIDALKEKYEKWEKALRAAGETDKADWMRTFGTELQGLVDEDVRYELKTTWTISTGHVSPALKALLDDGDSIPGVSTYDKAEYGWYMYVPEEALEPDLPQSLHDIIDMARKLGVSIVELDGDGLTVEELPTYNW